MGYFPEVDAIPFNLAKYFALLYSEERELIVGLYEVIRAEQPQYADVLLREMITDVEPTEPSYLPVWTEHRGKIPTANDYFSALRDIQLMRMDMDLDQIIKERCIYWWYNARVMCLGELPVIDQSLAGGDIDYIQLFSRCRGMAKELQAALCHLIEPPLMKEYYGFSLRDIITDAELIELPNGNSIAIEPKEPVFIGKWIKAHVLEFDKRPTVDDFRQRIREQQNRINGVLDALNVHIKLNGKGCIQLAKQSPDAATEADDRDRPGELLESPGIDAKQSPDAATAGEQGAEGAEEKSKGGRPPKDKSSTEELMRRKVEKDPNAVFWTANQFSHAIGKSETSVKGTTYWKELAQQREVMKTARQIGEEYPKRG